MFSTMHTKMFLFDTVGDARRVLTVTTANLAPGQTRAWNDAVTVVDKWPLYDAAADYFDKMALDLPTKEFTKFASSRDFRLFLFPYPRKQGARDYFTTSFKRIECRGVPRRAGRDGRTVVRLRSTIWRDNRVDVADRLVALHRAGCHVRATINLELTDPAVKQTLVRGGCADSLPVPTRRQHHQPREDDPDQRTAVPRALNTVHTGSTNPSRVAERRNDNAMIQVRDDRQTTELFLRNFATTWKHSEPLTREQVVNARPIPARVRG